MDFKQDILKYKAIIFDLDNTIYNEIEYLKKAYKYVASSVIKSENLNLLEDEIYNFLIDTFQNEGRFNLFQKMCKNFNLSNFSLNKFLYCLRTAPLNDSEIKINNYIRNMIKILYKKDIKIFIVTNGNESQQRNKIKSLDIPYKDRIIIIYASMQGKKLEKPNPFFIAKILKDYLLVPKEVLFIGDSSIDEETAHNSNITFLNVSKIQKKMVI